MTTLTRNTVQPYTLASFIENLDNIERLSKSGAKFVRKID